MFETLLSLFFSLLIVAIVGHALWLFGAACLGGVLGTNHPVVKKVGQGWCPRCNKACSSSGLLNCPDCGWTAETLDPSTRQADLQAVRREIDRWLAQGIIDLGVHKRLIASGFSEWQNAAARLSQRQAGEAQDEKGSVLAALVEAKHAKSLKGAESSVGKNLGTLSGSPAPFSKSEPTFKGAESEASLRRQNILPDDAPSPAALPQAGAHSPNGMFPQQTLPRGPRLGAPSVSTSKQNDFLGDTVRDFSQKLEPSSAVQGAAVKALVDEPRGELLSGPNMPPVRQAWQQLLARFLEESNVHIGELIGGALVVGCSIALVVSFWSQIATRPWLQFSLFNAVTAACYALHRYTSQRWKLPRTSQALFTVSGLLTPLNFLALASMGRAEGMQRWGVGAELAALGFFAALLWRAAAAAFKEQRLHLQVGVIGGSLLITLIARTITPAIPAVSVLLWSTAPLVLYVVLAAMSLRSLARGALAREALERAALERAALELGKEWLDSSQLAAWWRVLGVTGFALGLAFALLVYRTEDAWGSLAIVSPVVACMAAVPALLCLELRSRIRFKQPIYHRIACESLAGLFALGMLGAAFLAFPMPARLLAVLLVVIAASVGMAVRFGFSRAHAAAAMGMVVAFTLTGLVLSGRLSWWNTDSMFFQDAVLSARSAVLLTPASLVLCLIAWMWKRRSFSAAMWYWRIAAVSACVSVVSGTVLGFGQPSDPSGLTWLYLVHLAAILTAYRMRPRPIFIYSASVLLAACLMQGVIFRYGYTQPWLRMLLVAWTMYIFILSVALSFLARQERTQGNASRCQASLCNVLGAALLVGLGIWSGQWWIGGESYATLALCMSVQTLGWCCLLGTSGAAQLLPIVQLSAGIACACVTTQLLGQSGWLPAWLSLTTPSWLDPRFQHVHALAIGGECLLWNLGLSWLNRKGEKVFAQRLAVYSWDGLMLPLLVVFAWLSVHFGGWFAIQREFTSIAAMNSGVTAPVENMALRALGATGWLLSCAMAGIVLLRQPDRGSRSASRDVCLLVLLHSFVALTSGLGVQNHSSGAIYLLASTLFLGIAAAAEWQMHNMRRSEADSASETVRMHRRNGLVMAGLYLLPLVGVYLLAWTAHPFHGPNATSLWQRIEPGWRYFGHLYLAIALLSIYAWRSRWNWLLFTAGCCVNIVTTLLRISQVGLSDLWFDPASWYSLLAVNALAASGFSLMWRFAVYRKSVNPVAPSAIGQSGGEGVRKRTTSEDALLPLVLQGHCGLACLALLFLLAQGFLWTQGAAAPEAVSAGGWLMLAAIGISIASGYAAFSALAKPSRLYVIATCSLLLLPWTAMRIGMATPGDWWAPRFLMWGYMAVAAIVLVTTQRTPAFSGSCDPSGNMDLARHFSNAYGLPATAWSLLMLGIALTFASRALVFSPGAPWWTCALFAAGVFVATLQGAYTGRDRCFALATALFIAVTHWCWVDGIARASAVSLIDRVELAIASAALLAPVWMLVRLTYPRVLTHARPAWSSLVQWGTAFTLLTLSLIILTESLFQGSTLGSAPRFMSGSRILAIAFVALSGFARLYGRERYRAAPLYCCGLAGCALLANSFYIPGEYLIWTGGMVVSAFVLASSYFYMRQDAFSRRLHIPVGKGREEWLPVCNTALSLVVVLLGFTAQYVYPEFTWRFTSAKAILAQALAIAMLAGENRLRQHLTYVFGTLGLICLCLCGQPTHAPWMDRWSAITLGLSLASAVLSLGPGKLITIPRGWSQAALEVSPGCVMASLSGWLGFVLLEGVAFRQGTLEVSWTTALCVLASGVWLMVAALIAALVPGRDPLQLPESRRTIYIYAAEIILLLALVHLRMAVPWLFGGWFSQWWPLLVMLLALLGAALSEVFRRQGRTVLYEPLASTSLFLPALPLLAYIFNANAWSMPSLCFMVGVQYAAQYAVRRSPWSLGLSALAMHIAFWALLHEQPNWDFFARPQVWCIPPALSLLVSAQANRRRLSPRQLEVIRQGASMLMHASSAAEIFLHGVKDNLHLPLILAGLSLTAIFVGMAMRFRGFVIQGAAFLLLAIFTMIWFAAVDLHQTWIWYVCGLAAGTSVLAFFALLEGNKEKLNQMARDFSRWEG